VFTLGKRIKIIRTENKLTQQKFADLFGLVKSTICMYEKGNSTPDVQTLTKIADHFDVSLDWLTGRTNARNKAEQVLHEKFSRIIYDLGSDFAHQYLSELLDMSLQEKEYLKAFIDGIKLKRKQ